MRWDDRQARWSLILFLLLFAAGHVLSWTGRPIYPGNSDLSGRWPPEGCLLDATVLTGQALKVFPRGTAAGRALEDLGLAYDPLGSGFAMPRAGVLQKTRKGWRIRVMTQRERWVWRIPMDLYGCGPEDLARIRGIGPRLAGRIHRFVKDRGSLDDISELDAVPGIGPGILGRLTEELELPGAAKRR